MKKYHLIILFILSLCNKNSFAQEHTFRSNLPQTIIKEIKSENGKPYELIITLPPNFQAEKEYNVLYYLDAWWLRELVPGCYRIKSLSNKTLANNMLEIILVGISSVGNEEDWNRQRNMDYTPSKYNLDIVINYGSVPLDKSTTGGAKEFVWFLRDRVFKYVENEYPTKSSSRGILGHSFGGLFGFYAYLNHPDLFSKYILIAPAIWWNKSELFADKASFISKSESNMFVAMGTNEIRMMKAPIPTFIQYLNQEENSKLNMIYREYENEDHHSVLPQSIYDALEFVYTNKKKN